MTLTEALLLQHCAPIPGASAWREDSKEARRLRTTSACSRLAPPGARSASIAERAACSEASVSAILAPSAECCGTSSRRAYSVCARSSALRWISDHLAAAHRRRPGRRALQRRSSRRRQGSLPASADAWSPGLVIGRLPGWADSAHDTIVTVRHRAWGQIRRFRCAAFGCCMLRLSAAITASSIRRTAASRNATPSGRCP